MRVVCPYCKAPAQFVGGDKIYPHRPALFEKRFYLCEPCGAYVGCHAGGDKPLGRLANAELRRMKVLTHDAFDPLWKGGDRTRRQAYDWLSRRLGIPISKCHIGEFDVDTCRRVIELCRSAAGFGGS